MTWQSRSHAFSCVSSSILFWRSFSWPCLPSSFVCLPRRFSFRYRYHSRYFFTSGSMGSTGPLRPRMTSLTTSGCIKTILSSVFGAFSRDFWKFPPVTSRCGISCGGHCCTYSTPPKKHLSSFTIFSYSPRYFSPSLCCPGDISSHCHSFIFLPHPFQSTR